MSEAWVIFSGLLGAGALTGLGAYAGASKAAGKLVAFFAEDEEETASQPAEQVSEAEYRPGAPVDFADLNRTPRSAEIYVNDAEKLNLPGGLSFRVYRPAPGSQPKYCTCHGEQLSPGEQVMCVPQEEGYIFYCSRTIHDVAERERTA